MSVFVEITVQELDRLKKCNLEKYTIAANSNGEPALLASATWTSESEYPNIRWIMIRNDQLEAFVSWLNRSPINIKQINNNKM